MKVLMFGWEFPPHISGGLGTACFGLTKALMKERVKVLFVVPRLFGDEEKGLSLINASKVYNESTPQQGSRTTRTKVARKRQHVMPPGIAGEKNQLTYLEVPSFLSPYESPRSGRQSPHKQRLQTSNGDVATERYFTNDLLTLPSDQGTRTANLEQDTFPFTGTYGKRLLDEVKRYAVVAEKLTRSHSFDVIHVHDWMTFLAGVEARKKSGKPLIVHVHSTEYDRSGALVNREVLEIEKLGFMEADKIITVSNWTREVLVSRYNIPQLKISVVHNGISEKEPLEKEFEFPAIGSHFVTFLGRVTHQKGPWYFVEAASLVLKKFPEVHFIVAGTGDLLPQIIERVAQLNMSSNFHFTGFLSGNQVDRIWSLTDVYVMPSVSEPFGIAPLEAIQGDVPVIISRQSGIAEVMPHAIKVDFWDTRALAAAICSVCRYESLSSVLRLKSKQHLKHLSWNKAAQQVKALYYEAIAKE